MNINNRSRAIIYLSVFLFFFVFLIKEYIYIHPYNTGYGLLGPGWTYVSTRTITWWFILIGAMALVTPLFRIQKIGLIGLFLLIAVFVRPFVQYKFPEETAIEFYKDRSEALHQIIKRYKNEKDKTIKDSQITSLDFDQMNIFDGTYYFYLYDPEWPGIGICYDRDGKLPKENFGRNMKYDRIDKNWYEFKSH